MLDTAEAACWLNVNQTPRLDAEGELHRINFRTTERIVMGFRYLCHLKDTFPAPFRLCFQYQDT